jgi:hypothetical protein
MSVVNDQFVRLNAFQQVMRLWDKVHPYNAAHAFRVRGRPDVARVADAWRATLKSLNLGHVTVLSYHYSHTAPPDEERGCELQIAEPGTQLNQLISDQMNQSYDAYAGCPFRAALIPDGDSFCEDESYTISLTYHHWAADSASIRWLLNAWFERIVEPDRAPAAPAKTPEGGYWRYFGPRAAGWSLIDGVLGLARYRTRFSRVRQIDRPLCNGRVAVSFHELPDGTADAIKTISKREKVTVHDLLLATAAEAIDRHGVNPRTRHRDELSIGTIVDLRARAADMGRDLFGLFLGFTTTIVRPNDLADFSRLLQTVARQNRFQKDSCAGESSMLRLAAHLAESRLVSPRRLVERYRESMPLAVGISNVNLNRDWPAAHHPNRLLDYYRVAPTGAILPLVLTPTTLGNRMHYGITRLLSHVDEARCAKIVSAINNRLLDLTHKSRNP